MVAIASRLLGGAVVLAGLAATPSLAQSNPFVPASAASRAEVERIVDRRLQAMEERILEATRRAGASAPGAPGTPVAGAPGAPGVPGAPGAPLPGAPGVPGSPLAPGVAGINYPGAVPGTVEPAAPPLGAVAEARQSSGVRFIGCINGEPKFIRNGGERVSFTRAEIASAVRDGVLPACR